MANPARMGDNASLASGGIAVHPVKQDNRYQIGDPGRYLMPGLFQRLLAALEEMGVDPHYGYTLELEDPETGATGRITGVKSSHVGVFHPDDGHRDLGEFLTETGHIAFTEVAICVEADACDQCRWIGVDEPVGVIAGPGMLVVNGSIEHLRIRTGMPLSTAIVIPMAA